MLHWVSPWTGTSQLRPQYAAHSQHTLLIATGSYSIKPQRESSKMKTSEEEPPKSLLECLRLNADAT